MGTAPGFDQWLKQRRKALDLTQDTLAHRVGCATITIQKLEGGTLRPSSQMAERLADHLNLAPEERLAFLAAARGISTPPPAPSPSYTSLPIPPTPLLGRGPFVTAVCATMQRVDVRLLTLIGPPGVGKTRVALQVAHTLQPTVRDGAVFVALAPISDPELVPVSIAQALGIPEAANLSLPDQLKAALRSSERLLVLDNFEQVLAAGPLISELLEAAPALTVLVTSRAALHISGEHQLQVPPLALPDPHDLPPLDALAQVPAVALFVQRTQAVVPNFKLTETNAADVAAICQRLDGLPLALELAAARSKLFAPHALLAHLERPLAVLTVGARNLPIHQQTLRNTIAWSYDLLPPREQVLFARLSVFVGGFTSDAAADICTEAGDLPFEVLDRLALLLDQSLVHRDEELDNEPRFMMLETIREYALERLVAGGAEEAIRRRHAVHFLALAEAAEPMLTSAQRPIWLERLAADYDNLRAALVWSRTATDGGEAQLRLAAALWPFWYFRGYASEGRGWLEDALARTIASEPTPARALALCGAGALAWFEDDLTTARARLEESVALWRALGDDRGLAYALTYQGLTLQHQFDLPAARTVQQESMAILRALGDRWGLALALGHLAEVPYFQYDYAAARALYEESLALWREIGDRWGIAKTLAGLGFVAHDQGDDAAAKQLFEESVPMLRAEGNKLWLGVSLNKQGNVLRCLGDVERAAALYQESMALFREIGSRLAITDPLHNLGFVALQRGDNAHAAAFFAESLAMACQRRDQEEIGVCLAGLAGVVGARGQLEWAARLFGAVEAVRASNLELLDQANRIVYDRTIATVRAQLDEATFAAAWAEGRAMSLEQAIGYALEGSDVDSVSSIGTAASPPQDMGVAQ
jgi:predicted ATPase/DNA-binding XRE family transcriptional regulator